MQLFHVGCCTKCTSDFLPLGCARAQSPNYVNSFAVMATKPACTHCKTEKLKTWVLGLISGKLIAVTWSVGEFRWNKPDNRWVRNTFSRKQKTGRELPVYTQRKFCNHCDEGVFFTFVSRTDIIRSLASLTFSLFPHTLMCGSGKERRDGQTLKTRRTACV